MVCFLLMVVVIFGVIELISLLSWCIWCWLFWLSLVWVMSNLMNICVLLSSFFVCVFLFCRDFLVFMVCKLLSNWLCWVLNLVIVVLFLLSGVSVLSCLCSFFWMFVMCVFRLLVLLDWLMIVLICNRLLRDFRLCWI